MQFMQDVSKLPICISKLSVNYPPAMKWLPLLFHRSWSPCSHWHPQYPLQQNHMINLHAKQRKRLCHTNTTCILRMAPTSISVSIWYFSISPESAFVRAISPQATPATGRGIGTPTRNTSIHINSSECGWSDRRMCLACVCEEGVCLCECGVWGGWVGGVWGG